MHITRRGSFLALVASSLALSVAVGVVGVAGAAPARPSTTTQAKPCQGKGLCDVISFSPQIICALGGTCGLKGRPFESTITVTVYDNGKLSGDKLVTFAEVPNSAAQGLDCNKTVKLPERRTTPRGTVVEKYSNSNGPGSGKSSFCFLRAAVGKSSILGEIDQTDDPGTWAVAASPTSATRTDVVTDVAVIKLTVTNSADDPTTVNGDVTTFTNFFPSRVGACGGWTPITRSTGPSPAGQATLSYQPSPVGGPTPSVYCRFQGQEDTGGALSADIKIYQTKS